MLVSSIPIFVIENEFIQFVSVIVVGVMSYLSLIWLFALSEEEKMLLLNLKKKMVFQTNNVLRRNNKFKKE